MAGNFHITHHATQRWIERVEPGLSFADARQRIRDHFKAIDAALDISCKCVRLGNHARLILDVRLRQVVTVYPAPAKADRRQVGICIRATKRKYENGEWW